MKYVSRFCLLPLALAALAILSARAAHGESVSYALTLCEDLDVLKNPNNAIVAQNAALKSQFTLMSERTMPFIQLVNTSAEAQLTQLQLSVGDLSKNFDWATLVQTSPGVQVSIQNPDSIAGAVKSDLLVINFSHFDPGDFVRLRVGLSPDLATANKIMDYRNVLFQMNGSNTSNNAVANVSFTGTAGSTVVTNQLPDFVNANKFTSTNLSLLTTSCGMDSVIPFTLNGQASITPPTIPVPEPASVTLMAFSILGLFAWRAHKRLAR